MKIVWQYLWKGLVCLLGMGQASPLYAHQNTAVLLQQVNFAQHLGASLPLDTQWQDATGHIVELGKYFTTQPVILVPTYTNCARLCPLVLEGLTRSLRELAWNVGESFAVLVVSIDPQDTPASMADLRTTVLKHYARPGSAKGWHFLAGDRRSITRLTQALGFSYAYDAQQKQFAHPSGIVVATPQGTLARYFYGIDYPARILRLGLVEASANTIGSPVDQLLLRCYHYDPTTGRYSLAILHSLQWLGGGTVVMLGLFVGVLLRREWQRSRHADSV